MIATYRVLSAALSYPSENLQSAADEMEEALKADRLLPPAHIAAVSALIGDIAKTDLLDAQSQYVELFDRTNRFRCICLNMCMANRATAGRRWFRFWRDIRKRAWMSWAPNCPISFRCFWNSLHPARQ